MSGYVAPGPGGFVVVKDGQNIGTYANQTDAERAYNTATGQSNAAAGPAAALPDSFNPAAASYGLQAAQAAAQSAYQSASLSAQSAYQSSTAQGQSDRLAFDKATQAWNQTFQQHSLDQNTALSYLSLLGKLTGPSNAFNYARTLTGTPGGLADIVRAAGGGYRMPQTGGGSGAPPVPLSAASMVRDVNNYSASAGGGYGGGAQSSGNGAPAGSYMTANGVKSLDQMAQELKVAGWGGNSGDAAAVSAAYASTTKGAVTAGGGSTAPSAGQAGTYSTVNGTKTATQMYNELKAAGWGGSDTDPNAIASAYAHTTNGAVSPVANYAPAPNVADPNVGYHPSQVGADGQPTSSYIPKFAPLPAGNQIAPQNWNAMDPSQKALLMAAYSDQGYDPADVQSSYSKSLGAYSGPVQGGVGM